MEEKSITINELNDFLSNVSYNYYNVPMAMILSYWKHKFIPLTQNKIYENIIYDKNYKEKLRKSTGEKYSRILSSIQRVCCCDSIFQLVKQDKNENKGDKYIEPKYSIDLNGIKNYWREQASLMSRDYIVRTIENNKEDVSSKRNKIIKNGNSQMISENDITVI